MSSSGADADRSCDSTYSSSFGSTSSPIRLDTSLPPNDVSTSSSRSGERQRTIRPLGSARRAGRSRTPTPSNPHSSAQATPLFDVGSLARPVTPSDVLYSSLRSAAAIAVLGPPLNPAFLRQRLAPPQRPWYPFPTESSASTSTHRAPTSSSSTASAASFESSGETSGSSFEAAQGRSPFDRRAFSAAPEEHTSRTARLGGAALPVLGESEDEVIISALAASGMTGAASASSMASGEAHSHAGALQHGHEHGSGAAATEETQGESDEEKERLHFQSVLRAFDAYLPHSLAANNTRRKTYYALSRSHRLLLSSLGSVLPGPLADSEPPDTPVAPAPPATTTSSAAAPSETVSLPAGGQGYKARLDEIDDRLRCNADVLAQIVDDSRGFLGKEGPDGLPSLDEEEEEQSGALKHSGLPAAAATVATAKAGSSSPTESKQRTQSEAEGSGSGSGSGSGGSRNGRSKDASRSKSRSKRKLPDQDVDKIRSTLKQLVRDWSDEGAAEREAAYGPILDALDSRFGHVPSVNRPQVRVLVPGAGLGRLAFEIAWQGYSCQGNEYSFYMLLASHWILNKSTYAHEHTIYPYVHSSSNWRTAEDMLQGVRIPDVNPTELPPHSQLSMVAGEFVEVYSKPPEKAAWDAVATVYFVDTARNVVRYLEVLNHLLPIGGLWINVGPLLWHYDDLSVELTLEELMGLIELMGFEIEEHRTLPSQPYTGNPNGMLSYLYAPVFWVARKVKHVAPAPAV